MTDSTLPAEERIKEAAKKVFLEKGYDGATTRDIAREAGLNLALMNYYFRNKEKLFMQVYAELAGVYFKELTNIMNSPIELKEKIITIIDNHFEVLTQNPHLANFIHNEFQRNPEQMCKALNIQKALENTLFEQQWKEAIHKGEARAMDFINLLGIILANIQYLFNNQQLTMQVWEMNQAEYNQYAKRHKELSKEMVIHFIFNKPSI